jgi:lipopolysaccharide export system permease protein
MNDLAFEWSPGGIYERPDTLQPYVASGVPERPKDRRAPRADLVKIVTKYVLKEHSGPLVFSLSALTSLLLLNYVAKQLGQLVGKGLSWRVIAEFMLLSVPFTVAMTLPMAVLVATLHAFSRMAAENEITAFKASGMSIRRLMVPVIVAASVLTLVMVGFNDQVLPRANHTLQNLSNDIARKKPTFALKEQVINEVSPGRLYLRTEHLGRGTNRMRDVAIFDMSDQQRRRTIRADSGLLELSSDGRDLNLTLFDGATTELAPQEPARLQRTFFRLDFVKVRGVGNTLERDPVGGVKSDREMTVCELQARVVLSKRTRDSTWNELQRTNAAAARSLRPPNVPVGLGDLYCRLRGMTFVRAAGAAEVGPGTSSDALSQVPAQAPVREPNAAATSASQPAPQPDTLQRFILTEGVRLQLAESQRVIDGNQVEIEKKFAIAAACVVFVLLGAPIALRFPRGGVGLTIGVSLGVFGMYYVGLIAGETLARRGWLSPFWAMWTANFVLLVVGVWFTARLGSEGTTTRGSETSELLHRVRERLLSLLGRRRVST